jgi:hypothetical protein
MLRELGHFELALTITSEYSAFNVVSVLKVSPVPSEHNLKQALLHLRQRHPLLSAHISKSKNRYYFITSLNREISFVWINRTSQDQWRKIVEDELNTQIDILSGPLWRCTCLCAEDDVSEVEIIFTFHHSIVDASSAANLMHEFLSLCEGLEFERNAPEFPQLSVYPPAEAFFPAEYTRAGQIWPKTRYLSKQFVDEIRYQIRSLYRRKPPVRLGSKARIMTMHFDTRMTEGLTRESHLRRITLNSLLNSALLLAINRRLYGGESTLMRTFTFADLRLYVNPPAPVENLGSYVSMLRFSFLVSGESDLWALAREMQDTFNRSFKAGDKLAAPLTSPTMMKMLLKTKKMRMGATALSFTGSPEIHLQYSGFQVKELHGFISNIDLGPEFSAQVQLFRDRLWWDMVYLDKDMDMDAAKQIANEIHHILDVAIQ